MTLLSYNSSYLSLIALEVKRLLVLITFITLSTSIYIPNVQPPHHRFIKLQSISLLHQTTINVIITSDNKSSLNGRMVDWDNFQLDGKLWCC